MKFLIAGLGSIGRRHLRNLVSLGEKDILLFRTHQATLPDEELAGFPVATVLEDALAQKPDAVIVANPTSLHLDVAVPAAKAGCHLLLEKPLSNSMDGIAQLREAVAAGKGKVLVGFQFRYHPGLNQISKMLKEGAIGRPLSVRVHWGEYLPNWHPWEDYRQGYAARSDLGGGVVLTLCHPLDYLRWLLGDIQELFAFGGQLSDLGLKVADTAEISLHFANGVVGSVHLNYNQRPPVHMLEIVGTGGAVRWDNADGTAQLSKAGQPWANFPVPTGFERNWLFQEEIRHFLAVCRGDENPICTLEDGVWVQRLAMSALSSIETGAKIRL
jgi:predicted dehydrogenase